MTNEQVLVSIIVPIYNAELYLEKCLESITGQSYTNTEIILVDDGSTDLSLQICRKYAEHDRRINIFTWENHGLIASRKKGISLAHGKYFLFVDSDDYIDSDTISILFRRLDGEPDIVAFGLIEEYQDQTVIKKNIFDSGKYDRTAIKTHIFPQMISYGHFFNFGLMPNLVCKLIRRDFYNSAILHVSDIVSVGEDADLSFQLMMQASKLQIEDFYPYHYSKREDSMMWSDIKAGAIEALEDDLRKTASEMKLADVFSKQIDDYISFVRLLKNPKNDSQIIRMFGSNERIALYGAGGFGQALYAFFSDRIVIWVDRENKKYANKGFPVNSPEELITRTEEYDIVFVSILDGIVCEKVKGVLEEKLPEKKILGYKRN